MSMSFFVAYVLGSAATELTAAYRIPEERARFLAWAALDAVVLCGCGIWTALS